MSREASPLSDSPRIAVAANVGDEELGALLRTVYVGGGFTDPALADKLFDPAAVRARGTLITARDPSSGALLGTIVLVPPGATVKQIATADEAEVHLLAVLPAARGRGVGRRLIEALVALAASQGWPRIVLSTQERMSAAQQLYARAGFSRLPQRDWIRAGRRFLAYGLTAA